MCRILVRRYIIYDSKQISAHLVCDSCLAAAKDKWDREGKKYKSNGEVREGWCEICQRAA